MYRSRMVPSSLLAAVLLAGCGSGAAAPDASAGGGSTASAAVEPSTPTTSQPADPTGDGTVDEVSGGEGQGAEGSGAEDLDGGTEGLPGWPIESTPVHGAELWAAYVAVGAPGDPVLQQVLEEVQQHWPGAGLGELGCDDGAAEALGRDRTEHAVAVYFDTEQHITEFRRRWDGHFVGAAPVTTLCAD